ncbi:MAG: type VII secretion protein EccE, partial [Micromonosporaceae bacterium]|nr:type VII secretion protein EccE [Micromonosporaceae bacterium]
DVGPVPAGRVEPAGWAQPATGPDGQPGAAPWHTSLVVRDELTAVDADLLARADLVLLGPLDSAGAVVAGSALDLGDSQQWLTRIRPGMVGVVSRRTVRWAVVDPTPIERQLIG